MVDFRILGPLEASFADAPIRLGGGKQRALLAILLLNAGRTVATSRLVDDLWGEDVPDTATKMVQIYVSQLRKALPPGTVRTKAPGYQLDVDPSSVDLFCFERLVREGRRALAAQDPAEAARLLREALALWRGPALAQFAEPFAGTEARRLDELHIAAIEERIEADLALGAHADVVAEVEALSRHHPLRERLRAQLMLALYRSGRQAEALAAYQDARRVLSEELGIEPSAALRDLERRILRQDPSLDMPVAQPQPAPEEVAPGTAAPFTRPPHLAHAPATMVGRSRELGLLTECLRRALAGERQIVFLIGEAGLGKTTLVEALIAGLPADAGIVVGRGQCVEQHGAGEAYLPVIEALDRILSEPPAASLVEILAERAPTWLIQMPWLVGDEELTRLNARVVGANRERMLREMVEALRALTRERPAVLLLEDLHWSDASTVDLLGALARRRDPARLLVLATYRPGEAGTRSHPVHALAHDLRMRRLAEEVVLDPLREADVAEYLEARAPGAVLPEPVHRALLERSNGNPLFLEKAVDAWIEEGALREEEGAFSLTVEPARLVEEVPATLVQLIRQRLGILSTGDRELIDAAAVAGPEFSAALVAWACDRPEDDVEARCEALGRAGFIIEPRGEERWPDGTVSALYGFTHDLCQEVLYQGLSAGRRARTHRRIGERLQEAFGRRTSEIAGELAAHFLRAGDDAGAVRHLLAAARRAFERRAPREATGHLQAALRALESLPAGEESRSWELTIQSMLGPGLIASEGWSSPEAEAALVRARRLAEEIGGGVERGSALFMLATLYETRGEYERSEALLEEIIDSQVAGPGPVGLVDVYEVLACSLFHQGAFARALDTAERGILVVDGAAPNPMTAVYGEDSGISCHIWATLSLWFLGFPDRAREGSRRAIEMAEGPSGAHGLAMALGQAAVVAQCLADADSAREHAERAIQVGTQDGFVYRVAMSRIIRGWALAAQGAIEEGLAEIRRGMESSRATGAHMDDAYYLGLLADVLFRAGRLREALAAVGDALAVVPRGGRFFYDAELHRLRGAVLLRSGDAAGGEAALRRSLEISRAQGARSLELRAAVSLGAHLAETERGEEARDLVAPVYAAFTEGLDTEDVRRAAQLLRAIGSPAPAAAQATPRAAPRLGYARSGGLDIAYEVSGDGPVDVVLVPGFLSHIEMDRREPRYAGFLDRIASFSRLIRFDKRGTGLSDRLPGGGSPTGVPDLEARMDDVRAVMDAARSERAVLLGYSEGGPMSILFAATHPDRVLALVLVGAFAKRIDPDEDYPWAPTREMRRASLDSLAEDLGFERQMERICPSADEAMARWWGERCRAAASPGATRTLVEMNSRIDVRGVLPAVSVPTLVVHRVGDVTVNVEEGRYLARRIPGARIVELPGQDHFVAIDADQMLDVVEPFVAEVATGRVTREDRSVLATVLATADPSGEALARETSRFSGSIAGPNGGRVALFDGPARAIRCGLALVDEDPRMKVGVHTGAVERQGDRARGAAVGAALELAADAAPGEVLVTATTRDLVPGSGLTFDDRGERSLAGLDGPRRVYAARQGVGDERSDALAVAT